MNPLYIRFFSRLKIYLLSRLQGLVFKKNDDSSELVNQAVKLLENMPAVNGDEFKDWLAQFLDYMSGFREAGNPDLAFIHAVFFQTISLFDNGNRVLQGEGEWFEPISAPVSKKQTSFFGFCNQSSDTPLQPKAKPKKSGQPTMTELTDYFSNLLQKPVEFRFIESEDGSPPIHIIFFDSDVGKQFQGVLDALGFTAQATEYRQKDIPSHTPKFCLRLEQRHTDDLFRLAGREIDDNPSKTPEQIAARLQPILREMRSTEWVLAQQAERMAKFLESPFVLKSKKQKITKKETLLLKKAVSYYRYIAEHPFPFFKEVNFTKPLTLSDLFAHIQQLAKQLSHPVSEIIQLFLAFKWITANYVKLNEITAKLAAPADEYIRLESDGAGQGISKQTVVMTCLSPPIQRVPRYALFSGEFLKLFDDVHLAINKDMSRFTAVFLFIDKQFNALAQSVDQVKADQPIEEMNASLIGRLDSSYREDISVQTFSEVKRVPEVEAIDEEFAQILALLENNYIDVDSNYESEDEIHIANLNLNQNRSSQKDNTQADVFLIPAIFAVLFIAILVTLILVSAWYIALVVGLASLVASMVLFEGAYDDYTLVDEGEEMPFLDELIISLDETSSEENINPYEEKPQEPYEIQNSEEENEEEILLKNSKKK